MLEQLFGSRTRWKLLKLFLTRKDEKFFVRELARLTGERINSVRRELANLERWGLVGTVTKPGGETENKAAKAKRQAARQTKTKKRSESKRYYQADLSFPLLKELTNLVMKSWLMVERSLAHKLEKFGSIKVLVLAGRFMADEDASTDVFIVGTVNRDKLRRLMKSISRSFGEELRYTVMTQKEYKYRREITDRFLYGILEGPHITVIDRINHD